MSVPVTPGSVTFQSDVDVRTGAPAWRWGDWATGRVEGWTPSPSGPGGPSTRHQGPPVTHHQPGTCWVGGQAPFERGDLRRSSGNTEVHRIPPNVSDVAIPPVPFEFRPRRPRISSLHDRRVTLKTPRPFPPTTPLSPPAPRVQGPSPNRPLPRQVSIRGPHDGDEQKNRAWVPGLRQGRSGTDHV